MPGRVTPGECADGFGARCSQVSEKEREAAEQEVQLLKALDHAFVLTFHDAFIYKNHLCIITECVMP